MTCITAGENADHHYGGTFTNLFSIYQVSYVS